MDHLYGHQFYNQTSLNNKKFSLIVPTFVASTIDIAYSAENQNLLHVCPECLFLEKFYWHDRALF